MPLPNAQGFHIINQLQKAVPYESKYWKSITIMHRARKSSLSISKQNRNKTSKEVLYSYPGPGIIFRDRID